MTNCQPDVLDQATVYMRIYFAGMPFIMLYNFVAAILRATGDSLRPMIYMITSGVLNVVLNIFFVGALNMSVSGVALATVLSNVAALIAALVALAKNKDYCKIELKNLRLRKQELYEMIRIGIPTCLCGIFFYAGEVVVVSCMNSISTDAMTANAVASQLDRFTYSVGASIASAAGGVMVAQNYGAERYDRIPKIMKIGAYYLTSVIIVVSIFLTLFADFILGIFTDSEAVISLAKERFILLTFTNFITCTSEVYSNTVRVLKRQRSLTTVGFVCGFAIRSGWALLIWPLYKTIPFLFVCLPLSTFVGCLIYRHSYKKGMTDAYANLTSKIAETV